MRRHQALKAGATIEHFTDNEIHERDGWRCGICGAPIDRRRVFPDPMSPSIDHVVPLALGGEHSRRNVQSAHLRCNSAKGARVESGGKQLRLVG